MARLQSPKAAANGLWHEYGGWVLLMFAAYALWTFRKVFSSLGDVAGDTVAATVAHTQATAQAKADQTKVQQATGTTKKFTDAQIATFRADAEALAGYFKTSKDLPLLERSLSFADDKSAFSLLKTRYPGLKLVNNMPIIYTGGKVGDAKRPFKNVTKVTPQCVKAEPNWRVLVPFYKEATDGRNLLSDVRATLTGSEYKTVLAWVLT